MTVLFRVKIEDEVREKLIKLLPVTAERINEAMEEIAVESILVFKDYPPETEANQPPPPYYQRGIGYYGRTGQITKPSQQLDTQWAYSIDSTENSVRLEIENIATYAQYVHGDEDQLQMPWHAARGWPHGARTVADIVGGMEGDVPSGVGPSARTGNRNILEKALSWVADWFNR
jgi:hypothetical protein